MTGFFKTYGFFWKQYRGRTTTVIMLLILAGMIEAVGVAAFLPFLQIVLEPQAPLPESVAKFVDITGVPLNMATVGSFIAVVIVSKAAILWLALSYVSRTVARISADLRQRLMEALLKAQWRFFVNHTMGETLNAMVMETFRASMAFISASRLISALIQVVVYASAALLLSWQVFAGGMTLGLLLVAALWGLVHTARRAGGRQTEIAKDLMTQMADMLQGIKPLRAMALERKFIDILGHHSKGLEEAQADQMISGQSMRIFHEPLMVVAAVAGLAAALHFTALTTSEIALMAVLFIRLMTGMNNAQGEYQRLVIQESALWSLLASIEEAEAAADNWPGRGAVPARIENVTFSGVSFAYGDKPLLAGVDLRFPAHSLTALVGSSGSGKTTILDLLSGFYRPSAGTINVNGQSLSGLSLGEWRRAIGFVPQEVFLFNDSIYENIVMARAGIGEAEVWAALAAAGARDFVESKPEKLYAPVGENGRMLSGGQRQRIAIARAIVHKPQILILDEATSAVDQETEQVLLRTLRDLTREMTVVFVSHNKAVLAFADHVYEIREGHVQAAGKDAA